MVGDVVQENEYMWQFNETKIHNVIERKLLRREGVPTVEDLNKVRYEDIVEAHRKIFRVDNMQVFSHGDLHPAVLAPKL